MSEERYRNGKIYTVRYINDNNLIYVGSNCLPLYKRWYRHKYNCFNENSKAYNIILYKKIRETNNINDWYIELYEDYPTTTKNLLEKREGEIIRNIGTLNKYIAGRTKKEYYEDNKEKENEYRKEYYQNNKDKINQYREDNQEKIKEQKKEYYEDNQEKILERQKEYDKERCKIKIVCACGCELAKPKLKRHQQTNKHLNLMKLKNNKKII
jgi:hypothetical protein